MIRTSENIDIPVDHEIFLFYTDETEEKGEWITKKINSHKKMFAVTYVPLPPRVNHMYRLPFVETENNNRHFGIDSIEEYLMQLSVVA